MIQTETEGAIQFELHLWINTAFDTHGNGAGANSFPKLKKDITGTSSQ